MSSSPSPSLPFLPTEVKKEILRFCDQPTLAKTSTLSLAFLQLSSPLLYRHIEFEGPERLKNFFSLVAEKRHSELEPFLSLNLVDSVTYFDTEDHFVYEMYHAGQEDDSDGFVPRRLLLNPSSTLLPLPLTSLHIHLPRALTTFLTLNFFNPTTLSLHGHITSLGRASIISLDDWDGWTRLRALIFDDALADVQPTSRLFSPSVGVGRLSLTYNLSTTEKDAECLRWLCEDFDVEGDDANLPLVKEVLVTLASEELRRVVLERLAGSPLLPRNSISVRSNGSTFDPLQSTQPTITETDNDH